MSSSDVCQYFLIDLFVLKTPWRLKPNPICLLEWTDVSCRYVRLWRVSGSQPRLCPCWRIFLLTFRPPWLNKSSGTLQAIRAFGRSVNWTSTVASSSPHFSTCCITTRIETTERTCVSRAETGHNESQHRLTPTIHLPTDWHMCAVIRTNKAVISW